MNNYRSHTFSEHAHFDGAGARAARGVDPTNFMSMAERLTSHCSKGHEKPALSSIIAAFDLKDSGVLNAYVVGSHLWETCHKNSDWDLVIVLDKLSTPKPLNLHRSNLEAFILSLNQYSEMIQTHSMQILITVWLPECCILREIVNPKKIFQFSQPALIAALEHSKERDLRIAEKHFHKNDSKKAKKVLLHCMRYLNLGAQISSRSAICDYTSANEYRETVLGNYSSQWPDLMTSVQRIIDQLQHDIQSPSSQ